MVKPYQSRRQRQSRSLRTLLPLILFMAWHMVGGAVYTQAQQTSAAAGGRLQIGNIELHDVIGQPCSGTSASANYSATDGFYGAVRFPPVQQQTPWAEATTEGGPFTPPFAHIPIASLAASCMDPEGGKVILESIAPETAAGLQVTRDGEYLDCYLWASVRAGDFFLYTVRGEDIDGAGDGNGESASFPAIFVYRWGPSQVTLPDQTVAPGTTLSLANYVSGNNGPYASQLVSAPSGMTLDPATGVISWTPSRDQGPATYPVVVAVRSMSSPSFFDAAIFTVTVPRSPITGNDLTWVGGGTFDWRIDDTRGVAGASPGWDLLNLSGTLAVTATPDQKFIIRLVSLGEDYSPGPLGYFSGLSTYQWTIASAAGGIQGFDPANFTIDTNQFQNQLQPGFAFSLRSDGKSLTLNYERAVTLLAADDAITRHTNEMVQVLVSTLLANDSDLAYPPLTIISVSPTSAQGAPVENYLSYLYYMPPAGMNKADTFTYTVRNSRLDTATATVTITVVPVTSDTPKSTLLITDVPGTGGKSIHLTGTPGHRYELQATTNLLGSEWWPIQYLNANVQGTADATDSQAPQFPSRFYRAVQRVIVR